MALCLLLVASPLASAHNLTGKANIFGIQFYNTYDEAKGACQAVSAPVKAEHEPYYWCTWSCGHLFSPTRWRVRETCSWTGAQWDISLYTARYPSPACPAGTYYCDPGVCGPVDGPKNLGGCGGKGNPCNPATGNKYQAEEDYRSGDGSLSFTRHYNSLASSGIDVGANWIAASRKRLEIAIDIVRVRQGNGRVERFTCPGGPCQGDADTKITLTEDASGYTLTTKDGAVELYDTAGRLLSETDSAGRVMSYTYDAKGQLSSVTGPFGHGLTATYTTGRISKITDSAGQQITYTYDANTNNLIKVTYPDGTAKLYHYENATFKRHLTGISYMEVGGATTRYATYAYDAAGKAISTEHAGGVQYFGFAYDSDTQTTVTDAAATQEVMTFATNLGVKHLIDQINLGDGKTLTQSFDANNNLICRRDEEGRVTTYTYNASNQKTSMTEGLTGSCPDGQPTSATRTTVYQYVSPTMDLPTLIQSPSVYGGQSKTVTITYGDPNHPHLPTSITQSGMPPVGPPFPGP